MTSTTQCQLLDVVLWNETGWAIVHTIRELGIKIQKGGLALNEKDFTVDLASKYGDKHYSSRCYKTLAEERLERLLVCP